jgi:hypothetical protein
MGNPATDNARCTKRSKAKQSKRKEWKRWWWWRSVFCACGPRSLHCAPLTIPNELLCPTLRCKVRAMLQTSRHHDLPDHLTNSGSTNHWCPWQWPTAESELPQVVLHQQTDSLSDCMLPKCMLPQSIAVTGAPAGRAHNPPASPQHHKWYGAEK